MTNVAAHIAKVGIISFQVFEQPNSPSGCVTQENIITNPKMIETAPRPEWSIITAMDSRDNPLNAPSIELKEGTIT